MSKPRTRSSTSLGLDTCPALKQRKREEGECLDSKRNRNARLLALSLDLWCYIRDYIGWMKLLPLARVCKRLEGLVKTPQVWKGLAELILGLSEFRKGEPLVALSEVWRQSTVSFPKVRMAPETTDSVLKLLSGVGVQHLTLRDCRQVSDAGLAHLSELGLLHLDLEGCEQVTDAGLAHLSALPLRHLDLNSAMSRTLGWLTCLRCPSSTSISKVATKSRTLGWLTCLRFPCSTSISLVAAKSRTLGWFTCLRCPCSTSISLLAGK
eukprot:g36039.t1